MSDLSPELQRLVQAGKLASRPQPADFDRVFLALEQRVGQANLVGELTPGIAKNALLEIVGKVAIAVVGFALIGGGIAFTATHRSAQERSPAVEAIPISSAAIQPTIDAEPTVENEPQRSAVTAAEEALKTAPVTGRPREGARDNLSEEVAILYRAEAELHSGRAANALRILNDHERRFARGILAEERTAARIQALCALGRTSEANALIARLHPGSLHGERSRDACGSSVKAKLPGKP